MRRTIAVVALLVAPFAARLEAQGPPGQPGQPGQPGPQGQQGPQQDPFGRYLFPPELVMQHQGDINLQEAQRATLQSAVQQAQAKFVDVQWKLSAEGEK